MYKSVGYMLIICLFLSGCMGSAAYKDEDVAAVVRGEEITVGYLRILYPDDSLTEIMDRAVQAKLAELEVNKMNIDISEYIKKLKETYGKYPEDGLHNAEAQSIRSFADPQAEKLEMDPKEYYELYKEISAKRTAYIQAYISEILGGLEDDEFGVEEYNHHANELLDDLSEQNKDVVEVLIQ